MIGRPSEKEYAAYYAGYVSLVPETDVIAVLEAQADVLAARLRGVLPERETYAYAPGKWSIRELVGHVSDTERVFGYRAFCIGRGEETPLPAFDEKEYAARGPHAQYRLAELVEEFTLVRRANLLALRRLPASAWANTGTVSGNPTTVRALAFIMAGHVRHHLNVLGERYSVQTGA